MSPGQRLVIVGHGMAAVRLVETLVAGGDNPHQITVLGDEPSGGYNRILLSAVLDGSHQTHDLALRADAWYRDHGVDLRPGDRVQSIDLAGGAVRLASGDAVPFDRLVLATGSIPTVPPIRGIVAPDGELDPRVHAFRSRSDCDRLRAEAAHASRAVVVGGGLLGLQIAAGLVALGVSTEIVEVAPRLMVTQLEAEAASVLRHAVEQLGAAVYTEARVAALTPSGVRLDNGYQLETDLVVLACGGRPAARLAVEAGLFCRRGVVVDETLTSVTDDRVHAIGDCAEFRGRSPGFVSPAWEMAEVLGRRLRGEPVVYDGSRVVARLRAAGLSVAVLGDPIGARGERARIVNPVANSYRGMVVDGGRVTAAALIGDLSRVGAVTQLFDRGLPVTAHDLAWLLLGDPPIDTQPAYLPDSAQVCACAGVSAGAVRRCRSVDEVVAHTRATTGCGTCLSDVRG